MEQANKLSVLIAYFYQEVLDVSLHLSQELCYISLDCFQKYYSLLTSLSGDAKRTYNSVRPVTAINNLIDPEWKPYLSTPPFAEYVSGHSTFSASAAEILKQFTGSDYYGGSYTDSATGITLSWNTFSDAADQAGMSRLYGGIHFMDGNHDGLDLGRKVAGWDWKKVVSHILPDFSNSGNSGLSCTWH